MFPETPQQQETVIPFISDWHIFEGDAVKLNTPAEILEAEILSQIEGMSEEEAQRRLFKNN
jgi:hypothetical protein